ncbi:MAG: ribose transport system substrate-binding protein [Verrucomicrobiales bacterium]|jgi:ribose transport system substrate-binding protein
MKRSSFLLLAPLLLIGCGGDDGSDSSAAAGSNSGAAPDGGGGGAGGSKGVIGATCMTTNNPFFITIKEAMEEEAEKHGYVVEYLSGDDNSQRQHEQIKAFIEKGVDAIAINPVDAAAIGSSIRDANTAGIPVFTFDMRCSDAAAEVVAHVGTDNFQGGELAGQAMNEVLGEDGGEVVIIDLKRAESCQQRVAGFKKYVGEHPEAKIQIVAELPGYGDQEKGFKAAEDALQAYPNLAGIFAINDPSGVGAVAALEKAGKLGQVKVVAFDGQLLGKQAILEGKIYADPIQFPDKIGRKTIQAILAHFRGDEVEPDLMIPSALYRQADALKDPELGN